MIRKFVEILSEQTRLLNNLVTLASVLHKSLLNYDTPMIEKVTVKQDEVIAMISAQEEDRLILMMEWLKLDRMEANNLRLSTIERNLNGRAKEIVSELKSKISSLNTELEKLNRENRILANKARYSVANILHMLSSDHNAMCNVQV